MDFGKFMKSEPEAIIIGSVTKNDNGKYDCESQIKGRGEFVMRILAGIILQMAKTTKQTEEQVLKDLYVFVKEIPKG